MIDREKLGGCVDKSPSETNQEYCRRVAEAVDKDELIRSLVLLLQSKTKSPAWSVIGAATSNGCGVSTAIAQRFGFTD